MDVTPLRDAFGRPVPDCQVRLFRARPHAVCPLCDGHGDRPDGKTRRLCHLCGGNGHLNESQVASLNPDLLAICKGFARNEPPPEPTAHPPTPKKRKEAPCAP